jgi:hypothetical protein
MFAFIGIIGFELTKYSSVYGQPIDDGKDLALSINTDREVYSPGQDIRVFGKLTGAQGNSSGTKMITAELSSMSNENILQMTSHRASIFSTNGSYTYQGIMAGTVGDYNVTAIEDDSKTIAWTTFRVIEPLSFGSKTTWVFIGIELAAFGGLLVLMYKCDHYIREKNNTKFHKAATLRFLCLSIIALIPLVALAFFAEQMIPEIIVSITQTANNNATESNGQAMTQWVSLNFIGIPFYVIAFALLGGYVGYLYKVITKEETSEDIDKFNPVVVIHESIIKKLLAKITTPKFTTKEEIDKDSTLGLMSEEKSILKRILPSEKKSERTDETTFVHKTLEELADIIVAPVLAIAVWLLVSQQITNVPTLALLSLAIGLITKNVIEGFRKFALIRFG